MPSLPQALCPPLPPSLSIRGWDGRPSRQLCHRSVWTEWQTPVPQPVCSRVGAAATLQRLPEEASVCRSSGCKGWSLARSCPQLEETGLGPASPAARQPQQLHWQQQDTAWWWWAQQIPSLTYTHSDRTRGRGLWIIQWFPYIDGKDKVATVGCWWLVVFSLAPWSLLQFVSKHACLLLKSAALQTYLCCRHNLAYSFISFSLTTSPPLSVPPSATLPPLHPSLLNALWLHL